MYPQFLVFHNAADNCFIQKESFRELANPALAIFTMMAHANRKFWTKTKNCSIWSMSEIGERKTPESNRVSVLPIDGFEIKTSPVAKLNPAVCCCFQNTIYHMYLAMGIVLALNISHFWQDTIWVGNCQECNMETKALFSFHLDPMAFSFPFSCFPNPTLAPKTFFMLKLLPHWVTRFFGGLKVAICRESGDKHDDGKQLQSTADWSPASASSYFSRVKKARKLDFCADQTKPTGFPEPATSSPPTRNSFSAAATLCGHSCHLPQPLFTESLKSAKKKKK